MDPKDDVFAKVFNSFWGPIDLEVLTGGWGEGLGVDGYFWIFRLPRQQFFGSNPLKITYTHIDTYIKTTRPLDLLEIFLK